MSIRDLLLNGAVKLKTVSVPTPEWPAPAVTIREMTGAERVAWLTKSLKAKESGSPVPENYLAAAAASAIVNDDGTRAFTDEDAAALGQLSAVVLDRIQSAWLELNGLGGNRKKAEDEAAKN